MFSTRKLIADYSEVYHDKKNFEATFQQDITGSVVLLSPGWEGTFAL